MDVEKEDNLFCTNCNASISKNAKFCGSCGTKNEKYEEQSDFTNHNASIDSDVIAEEVNTSVKPRSKTGIKYGIIAAIIILVSFLSVNVFAKTIFPDKYVKGSILNTFNTINKNNKEFNNMPGILSYLSPANDVNENEIFIKFDGFGGDIDSYMSYVLGEYGLKANIQKDIKNSLFNVNFGILNGNNEIANAEMYGSNEFFSLKIPQLYDGYLGINSNSEIIEIYNEYDVFKNNATIYAKYYKAANESKNEINKITKKFSNNLLKLTSFKKGSSENTYVANINGEEFLNLLENYILELTNNESIRNLLFYTYYIESMNYTSYEYAKTDFDELMANFPDELKYNIDAINLDNIEISVDVNNKKLVDSFQVQAKLNNEYNDSMKVRVISNINISDDNVDLSCNLKLVSEYDSYDFSASIKNFKNNKNSLGKTIKFNMNSLEDETLSLEYNEAYDSSSKKCISEIILTHGSYYVDEFPVLTLKSEGIFDGKDKITFDKINVVVNEDDYYTYEVNLSGYIQNKNIKSVSKVDSKNITFINELSEDALLELMWNIESNMRLLTNEIF